MLKKKSVSPSTHQQRRHHLEVWATRQKEKLERNKKEFKNIFYKTIEMAENTMNKEHIKKIMAISKAKRPDIWSDYGNSSLWSFSSRSHKNKNNKNASFSSYQYVKLFKPTVDLSLESLSLATDNKSCSNDNVLNNNQIIARSDNNIKIENHYNSMRKEITFDVTIQNKVINDALNKDYLNSNKEKLESDSIIDYGNDNKRYHFINNDGTGINVSPL